MVISTLDVDVISQTKMEEVEPSQAELSPSMLVCELNSFELVMDNPVEQQWLFRLLLGTNFQASEVRSYLQKLQDQTFRRYAALYNPHTRYLLITIRG